MLVQRRRRAFRLIRQHDHALLSGALAAAWREPDGTALPWSLVLAIALHDVVWRDEDAVPRLDRIAGAPYDFTTLPAPRKRRLVRSGVERLRALEPDLTRLVEEHHETLTRGPGAPPSPELAWLRFFDNLSLWICLTAPGSLPSGRPPWLGEMPLVPPGHRALTPSWTAAAVRLGGTPPGMGRLGVPIPYRDLPATRYGSQRELRDAWTRTPERRWIVDVLPDPSR